MGILNATPDSFSDGGLHFDPHDAIAAGLQMIKDGAAILDIGGESTRPGATPIDPAAEIARVVPIIAGLWDAGALLSIDTRNAATMAAALDAGASIVNDVSALAHDPAAAPLIARRRCPVVLMHMRGTPATMMGTLATYADVTGEVTAELARSIAAAEAAGIGRSQIAIDPGFGFAKREADNVTLLRELRQLTGLGFPIVAGLSRKRFIGVLSHAPGPMHRDAGSIAAGLFALGQGVTILRVHNVADTIRAMRVWQALAA